MVRIEDTEDRQGFRVQDESTGLSTGRMVQKKSREVRMRTDFPDGSSCCLTEHPKESGGWQDGHFHAVTSEIYVVTAGHLFLVWIEADKEHGRMLEPGSVLTIPPNAPHNVYVFPGTKTIVVQQGGGLDKGTDKFKSQELDAICAALTTEAQMREFAARHP